LSVKNTVRKKLAVAHNSLNVNRFYVKAYQGFYIFLSFYPPF